MKKIHKPLWGVFILIFSFINYSSAQYTNCNGVKSCTDPENYGFNSDDVASLSYDNIVSAFHQSATINLTGVTQVWGEHSNPDGKNSFLVPTDVSKKNFPGITGNPVKISIGSRSLGVQYILLTDDNKLWVWGYRKKSNHPGAVVDNSLVTITGSNYYNFQQIIPDNNSGKSLPSNIGASDVKMMFVTWGTIAITTCDGDVWVLSQNDMINHGESSTEWIRAYMDDGSGGKGSPLQNVVATRGCASALMALTSSGDVYTWGYSALLGDNIDYTNIKYAKKMTLPTTASGTIKMIGATNRDTDNENSDTEPDVTKNSYPSYYILYKESGKNYGGLWTLGNNAKGQLGDWSTTKRLKWVQPLYDNGSGNAGAAMNDITWISPQEHDMIYPFVNAITKDGKLINWGAEANQQMGRGINDGVTGSTAVNPGFPNLWEIGSNENILAVESGGHTTTLLRDCSFTFGYIGHRIAGSMGDGNAADVGGVETVQFNTYPLQVCGVPTIPGSIKPERIGPYCDDIKIKFKVSPEGGTFSFHNNEDHGATIDNVTKELDPTGIDFNGKPSVVLRINYEIPSGEPCSGSIIQYVLEITEGCVTSRTVEINGNVWYDIDGDATQDGIGEIGLSNAMYVNLVNPNDTVLSSLKVNIDGTFNIIIHNDSLDLSGDYAIILTNDVKDIDSKLEIGDYPKLGYSYTGTNLYDKDNDTYSVDDENRD